MKTSVSAALIALTASTLSADPLTCNLNNYKPAPGLSASMADSTLSLVWEGDRGQELRLRLGIEAGTPTIRELAIRRNGGAWAPIAANLTPEFRVVSGLRRITNQQLQPLRGLNVPITQAIVDKEKWNAFWDAPLDLSPTSRAGNPPPVDGVAGQPGLPRKADEIKRATAVFRADRCDVRTDGARLEAAFPGVQLGVFAGRLQFTVYRGTNLLRMETIAVTNEPSVAYKYDAGFKGLTLDDRSRVVWRDLSNLRQDDRLGGAPNEREVPLKASNRLIVAESRGGSMAAFPPPHVFFWTREIETNLGYVWYRKDSAVSFSFGIRQAEREEAEQYQANFSLYSAPPGSAQRMPIYFYLSAEPAAAALTGALAFTRADRYAPLAGYKVMASHFHMDLGQRTRASGSLDTKLPDLVALRAAGINIVSPTDRPAHTGGRSY